jgi:hypothetical protein
MTIRVLRDPQRYLLALMVVALTVVVPLMFVFVTLTDHAFDDDAGLGWVALWVLSGMAAVTLVVGMMMMLARATHEQAWKHHD